MKSGASDPFADDEDTAEEESAAPPEETVAENDAITEGEERSNQDKPVEGKMGTSTLETEKSTTAQESEATGVSEKNVSQYPLTFRRNNVKDERPEIHQLFVQAETDQRARDAENELETRLGEDLYRLDAREAIYLAGMENLDDAAEILRQWGYDLSQ